MSGGLKLSFAIRTNRLVCLSRCFIDYMVDSVLSYTSNKILRSAWALYSIIVGVGVPQRASNATSFVEKGVFSETSVN